MVKWLKDNELFDVYKFEDIDIFLNDKLKFKDLLKLIYVYFLIKTKVCICFKLKLLHIVIWFMKKMFNFFYKY